MITVGPTGKLVPGDILDVNVAAFNRALRAYDPLLYTVWNPKKVKGWGCWEIRRRPSMKTAMYQGTHQGTAFYSLVEVDLRSVHHVLDCAFLNYDAIRKIKSMDTWATKSFVDDIEAREAEFTAETEKRAKEEMKYAISQNKSMARDLYEAVRSGISPAQVLTSTKWTQS
jgi:hypothetical protein